MMYLFDSFDVKLKIKDLGSGGSSNLYLLYA